jgi:ATP/maltotriose-dependent transcriptional regulator MalT
VLQARASLPEADLDFGIVDQLLRPTGEAVLTAETSAPTSSFAVGARLLEVIGEQLATGALAIVIDDLQWVDRKSAEALTFMLRRLSVDPVLAIMTYRRPGDLLDEPAQRMLASVENRLQITLDGLTADEVASLAAALRTESLDEKAIQGLYRRTGGHPLYLCTVLSEESGFDPGAPGRGTASKRAQ